MLNDEWPNHNPAWVMLVDQAWQTLKQLEARGKAEFHSSKGELDDFGDVFPIGSMIGSEAILDLWDQTQWARTIRIWVKELQEHLVNQDPLKVLRKVRHEEISVEPGRLAALAKQVRSEFHAEPIPKVMPLAVSAVVSCRCRARLLNPAGQLEPSGALLATLVLQSRVLLDGDLLQEMHVHPYAVYTVARALWLSTLALIDPEPAPATSLSTRQQRQRERKAERDKSIRSELERIRRAIERLTERLLARSTIGSNRDGENVALAFCAAILALEPRNTDYVFAALDAAARGQDSRGAWPQGRLIGAHLDPDSGQPLVVSSHEVALAFAEAIFFLGLRPGTDRPNATATKALQLAIDYLRNSRVSLPFGQGQSMYGWVANHAYGRPRIEARATAAALRLTVAVRGVAEQERSIRALTQFDEVWNPVTDYKAPYLDWNEYILHNDPDRDNPILGYLNDNIVRHIKDEKQKRRRPWARTKGMSAILFGPPGTTKTTIVKAMAEGLNWPLVTLSPGTFIKDGLENVERSAVEVFSHLKDLVRVVVLFDECDELFRARRRARDDDGKGSEEMRSISAFVTASMLPKLQDLHDNGQTFFVIATNYFDQIDSAAKRIGRIDRVVGVGWPDEQQRQLMIEQTLLGAKGVSSRQARHAAELLAPQTRFYVRGELTELAHELAKKPDKLMQGEIKGRVSEVLNSKSPSIEGDDRKAFIRDAETRSACHRRGRGELKA